MKNLMIVLGFLICVGCRLLVNGWDSGDQLVQFKVSQEFSKTSRPFCLSQP